MFHRLAASRHRVRPDRYTTTTHSTNRGGRTPDVLHAATRMSRASTAMAAAWWATGLGVPGETTDRGRGSARSTVHTAAVYAAYACLCAAYAYQVGRSEYGGGGGGSLQIRLIRHTDAALLSVASTAVYWCAAAFRREYGRVRDRHAAVARQLFGTPSASRRVVVDTTGACCWALYALLAAALALDVHRYAGPAAPWTYAAARAAGHYALLTGNVQFALTVLALRRCYAELNDRMRAGRGRRDYDDGPFSGSEAERDGLCDGLTTTTHSRPSKWPGRDDDGGHAVTFVNVLDKANLLTMLKYWSDLHWSITQIVSMVNNLFKFRLFIFFLCGLLHLMLTPYILSLIILNEDIDILRYILEYTLWFTIHILRVVLMIYPCALLGEEAAKTQILLGSYLNTKIDYYDIKRIETYAQHLAANKPEFSIYGMFVIDKQLVITLAGAVATYLVIILQLQGQS